MSYLFYLFMSEFPNKISKTFFFLGLFILFMSSIALTSPFVFAASHGGGGAPGGDGGPGDAPGGGAPGGTPGAPQPGSEGAPPGAPPGEPAGEAPLGPDGEPVEVPDGDYWAPPEGDEDFDGPPDGYTPTPDSGAWVPPLTNGADLDLDKDMYTDPSTGEITTTYNYDLLDEHGNEVLDPESGEKLSYIDEIKSHYDEDEKVTTYERTLMGGDGKETKISYTSKTTSGSNVNEKVTEYEGTDDFGNDYKYNYKSKSDKDEGKTTYTYEKVIEKISDDGTKVYSIEESKSYDVTIGDEGEIEYAYTEEEKEIHSTYEFDKTSGTYKYTSQKTEEDVITKKIDYYPNKDLYDPSVGLYKGSNYDYDPITLDFHKYDESGNVVQDELPGDKNGQLVITKDGSAFVFDEDSWKKDLLDALPDDLSEEELSKKEAQIEKKIQSHLYGESALAKAVDNGLSVFEVEKELNELPTSKEFHNLLEEKKGEPLTDEEKDIAFSRYLELENEIDGEEGVFGHTYRKQLEIYEKEKTPEEDQLLKNKDDHEDYLSLVKNHEDDKEEGDNEIKSADAEIEFEKEFKKKFTVPEIPRTTPASIIIKQIYDSYAEEQKSLEDQGIDLNDDNPVSNDLRNKINQDISDRTKDENNEVIQSLGLGTVGLIGNSQTARILQVNALKQLNENQDALSNEIFSKVVEIDCTGSSSSCGDQYDEILDELGKVEDDQTKHNSFLVKVDLIAEDHIAKETHLRNKEDSENAKEFFNEKIDQQYDLWKKAVLTADEHAEVKEADEKRRKDFVEEKQQTIESNEELPDKLKEEFKTKHEERLEKMDKVIDLVKEKGKDSDKLEFLRKITADNLAAAQADASEEDYNNMVANLEALDLEANLFIDEAKSILQ